MHARRCSIIRRLVLIPCLRRRTIYFQGTPNRRPLPRSSTFQENQQWLISPLKKASPAWSEPLPFAPKTAKPMRELAEILLRGPNSLTSADRESIAAFVSSRHECRFCQLSHSAAAAEHHGGSDADYAWIEAVKADPASASISAKLKSLLHIAGKVREGGKQVASADIAAARAEGAAEHEIHDRVLVAAAFCMYNRYVDGLATWQPEDPAAYRPMGRRTGPRPLYAQRRCRRWRPSLVFGPSPAAAPRYSDN